MPIHRTNLRQTVLIACYITAIGMLTATSAANEPESAVADMQCRPGIPTVWVPGYVTDGPKVYFLKPDPRYAVVPGSAKCEDEAIAAGYQLDSMAKLDESPTNAINQTAQIGPEPGANAIEQRVFFATDRTQSAQAPLINYGTTAGPLAFGQADVLIPTDYRPTPSTWRSFIVSILVHSGPEKNLNVVNVAAKPRSAFNSLIASAADKTSAHDAFVFVHGFNVSWYDAIRTTAELAFDLNFGGPAISFSWPSQGNGGLASLVLYGHDRTNAQTAANDFATLLDQLDENHSVVRIHIVAHSMGAYAFCMALLKHEADTGKTFRKVSDVSFAAPDVAVAQLQTLFDTVLRKTVKSITVYVSSKDVAMQGSIKWNGQRPLGDGVPPLVLLPGYQFVDASRVDTDFLGHGYFVDQDDLLSDIARTFEGDTYPRPLIHPLQQNGVTYYTF